MGENIKITIFNYKIFAALNIYLNFAFNITKEIVSQHYLSIISKVNAILEDVKNKTETDNKNKEKNMPKDHNHKAWKE